MRNASSIILWLSITLMINLLPTNMASAKRIEAVKGKEYTLTKRHGPWMIMVASLAEPPPERRVEGISPDEAAAALVYELRRKGIPAYTYSQNEIINQLRTVDRLGRPRQSEYTAQQDRIVVLAGNYGNPDSWIAQKTLEYVKKLHPRSWEEHGIYRQTRGRPGPLSGSFLTINPRLSAEEVAQKKRDPLLLKLNSGREYSILENKGRFTIQVASFHGKSLTGVTTSKFEATVEDLKVGDSLDEAALSAWHVAKILREQHNQEAYVFHDRHRSVVTVGSFESEDDPQIARVINQFRAKMVRHRDTGQEHLKAEMVAIPGKRAKDPPLKRFLFDPKPQLVHVPKLR